MPNPKLRIARTLLFKLFWVQLAFILIAWLVYTGGKTTLYPWLLAQSGIQISTDELSIIMLYFFGAAKFMLYFMYLIPAIAIHWTVRTLEKNPHSPK